MPNYSDDPIENVIRMQIKEPIRLLLEHKHFSSAIKLIYSGIDTMAYLSMSKGKSDVTKSDFVTWVDKYLKFKCREQLTGLDVYGARCSMLHNHGTASKLSRQGKCRQIGYADKMQPVIVFQPLISPELVLVSIPALAESFFNGVDKCLIDLFSNPKKKNLAESRLNKLVHYYPVAELEDD